MSYTPEPTPPDESGDSGRPKRPSNGRIAIWVAVAAVGLYFLISGVIGIIAGGH